MAKVATDTPLSGVLINGTQRLATCWEFVTPVGTYRWTDHSNDLVVDGDTYSPAEGISATAREMIEGTEPTNFQAIGVIDDDNISHDDLRSGRLHNTEVTEFLVDWKFPWQRFYTRKYLTIGMNFNGEIWKATIESRRHRLSKRRGRVYSKTCGWKLGDSRCQVDLTSFQTITSVASVDSAHPKRIVTLSDTPSADMVDGEFIVASGDNSGFTSEVKSIDGNVVELQVEAPFEFSGSDVVVIRKGCDYSLATCIERFDNKVHFGGHNHIIGTERQYETPDT